MLTSSTSQAEDIDDKMNGDFFDHNTFDLMRVKKEEPQVQSENEVKDRIKKDNHNMSELSF